MPHEAILIRHIADRNCRFKAYGLSVSNKPIIKKVAIADNRNEIEKIFARLINNITDEKMAKFRTVRILASKITAIITALASIHALTAFVGPPEITR